MTSPAGLLAPETVKCCISYASVECGKHSKPSIAVRTAVCRTNSQVQAGRGEGLKGCSPSVGTSPAAYPAPSTVSVLSATKVPTHACIGATSMIQPDPHPARVSTHACMASIMRPRSNACGISQNSCYLTCVAPAGRQEVKLPSTVARRNVILTSCLPAGQQPALSAAMLEAMRAL